MNKKIKLRICALALAIGNSIVLVGCNSSDNAKYDKANFMNKETIESKDKIMFNAKELNMGFKQYTKTIETEGKETTFYKTNNVLLEYNKETSEINEYVIDYGVTFMEIYKLKTGELVYSSNSFEKNDFKEKMSRNELFNLKNINKYIQGYGYKEWYSLEEINEITQVLLKEKGLIANSNESLESNKIEELEKQIEELNEQLKELSSENSMSNEKKVKSKNN